MGINTRIEQNRIERNIFPEMIMLSRYYVKKKYVQVIVDIDSFTSSKTLQATMQLPLLIFKDLDPEDHFGLRVLKDGFKTD